MRATDSGAQSVIPVAPASAAPLLYVAVCLLSALSASVIFVGAFLTRILDLFLRHLHLLPLDPRLPLIPISLCTPVLSSTPSRCCPLLHDA